MRYLILLLLVVSCTLGAPKYSAGTCFTVGLLLLEVVKVEDKQYLVHVHSFINFQKLLVSFREFEAEIEKLHAVPEKCDSESEVQGG